MFAVDVAVVELVVWLMFIAGLYAFRVVKLFVCCVV